MLCCYGWGLGAWGKQFRGNRALINNLITWRSYVLTPEWYSSTVARVCAEPMRNRSTTLRINSLVASNSSSLSASEPSRRKARSMARSQLPSGIRVVYGRVVYVAHEGVGVGVVSNMEEVQCSQFKVLFSQWLKDKININRGVKITPLHNCIMEHYHIVHWSGTSWFRIILVPWEILWPSWIQTWHWDGSTQRMATSSNNWPKNRQKTASI